MIDKNCIIFDIDGTLANIEHRLHYIQDGKRDWDSFFEACEEDTSNPPVAWLADVLSNWRRFLVYEKVLQIPFDLIICTGRPEKYREQTEKWLSEKVFMLDDPEITIKMRKDNDYRSDVIVKREMLEEIRTEGYKPMFVVDDRQAVVDMWREEGVTCLQCAPGDFDTPKYPVEPGHLYLMVGPSGSGKTSYLTRDFWGKEEKLYTKPWFNDEIISSDSLRSQFSDSGDFKDQSKNNEVFQALHAVVKTRIENGLDTFVDATNIKNKDRKVLRDLVPTCKKIYYVVIDRPLEDKIRDGGWRNDVIMKNGKTLIEYHHNTFQSNLKDILNGDGDPRVTVEDLRDERCK